MLVNVIRQPRLSVLIAIRERRNGKQCLRAFFTPKRLNQFAGLSAVLTSVVMGGPPSWMLLWAGFMGVIAGLMLRLIVLGWRTWPGLG